jgi:CRAL/TRIO domain
MTTTMEAYPIRTKGIHFISPGSGGFETLFKIFYSFLSEKIRNRVFIHATFEDLHTKIPREFLPECYGGTAGTVQSIAGELLSFSESFRK